MSRIRIGERVEYSTDPFKGKATLESVIISKNWKDVKREREGWYSRLVFRVDDDTTYCMWCHIENPGNEGSVLATALARIANDLDVKIPDEINDDEVPFGDFLDAAEEFGEKLKSKKFKLAVRKNKKGYTEYEIG